MPLDLSDSPRQSVQKLDLHAEITQHIQRKLLALLLATGPTLDHVASAS
jgi:hypothetical protein